MAAKFWILIFYTEQSDSDDWSDDYDSDNSWDVSFDDGEQDSNSEGANDDISDIKQLKALKQSTDNLLEVDVENKKITQKNGQT